MFLFLVGYAVIFNSCCFTDIPKILPTPIHMEEICETGEADGDGVKIETKKVNANSKLASVAEHYEHTV
ncbi:uncharacterized protein PV07_02255 [Cladophialophora immunda]|uniref:Uncharacterized protein n=1 Tax=Cladophialophora immunda TaxID=569365 RepID=A0A0D2D040_9EURO|nr:uncharacterized protein PV07_02255 [Cladophialophora immunda]KIW35565.1 hypothetical protein PV07_02255 [Cladophialophora immunda]